MTDTKYKIRFTESMKAVVAEVVVEGSTDDILNEAKELFNKAQAFAKTKTLLKM